MKKYQRLPAVLLTICLISGIVPMTSMASLRRSISSVSLTIASDFKRDARISTEDITVETSSDKYHVEERETDILNSEMNWQETDIPELEIVLYAEEGYYFNVGAADIKIKGEEGICTSAAVKDTSQTLTIKVKLKPIGETVEEIASASWSGNSAVWEEAAGAGSYEVKLYRDGKAVGSAKITEAFTYDFTKALTKTGTYSFRVRPLNRVKPENKGEWIVSGDCYVNETKASENRKSSLNEAAGQTGWIRAGVKWRYADTDGVYLSKTRRQIEDQWYFFDEEGYMVTGWTQWEGKWYYCREDGSMMSSATTPDGFVTGADGAWIPG